MYLKGLVNKANISSAKTALKNNTFEKSLVKNEAIVQIIFDLSAHDKSYSRLSLHDQLFLINLYKPQFWQSQ